MPLQTDDDTELMLHFRYKGWCETLKAMGDLDLTSLDEIVVAEGTSYLKAFAEWLGVEAASSATLREAAAAKLSIAQEHPILDRVEWLGLFSADEIVPAGKTTKLDAVTHLFEKKMTYAPVHYFE